MTDRPIASRLLLESSLVDKKEIMVLELKSRKVISEAPVKILHKPCEVFAVAGRLRAMRPTSVSSWRTRKGSWNCEMANLMCRQGRRWRTQAWSWSQDK